MDKKNIDEYNKAKDNISLFIWNDLQKRIQSLKQTFDDITGKINMVTNTPSRNGPWTWRESIPSLFSDNCAMSTIYVLKPGRERQMDSAVFSHKGTKRP